MRPTCLTLAAFVAAVHGFGVTPHGAADEYACRNKETPVVVSHAEMITDCVSVDLWTEEECTAELTAMQAADSVGCGAEPVEKTTYTGGSAPSALCDCCSVEVGQSEHKASLCALVEVGSTCAFTCTGSGDDNMVSLAQKLAIRKYKAENIAGGASETTTSFCNLVGSKYNWPCANPAGRRLGERRELFEKKEKADCEDATNEVVAKISEAALGRALSSCAELKDIVGACEREAAKMHCPASCGLCDGVQDRHGHPHRAPKGGDTCG
jgi:hypothetical protein